MSVVRAPASPKRNAAYDSLSLRRLLAPDIELKAIAHHFSGQINALIHPMDRRIDAHITSTQLDQIMDQAVKNNERFIVDRRDEPAVVIMSVQDFIRTVAPRPDWLTNAWADAKRRGLDNITLKEINAEINAYRQEQKPASDLVK